MSKLELKNISHHYPKSKRTILDNINLILESGKVTAIIGESGAGKSTMLYILCGLTKPSTGEVIYDGEVVEDIVKYRRNISGIISQNYLLFPDRTALENVIYPLELHEYPKDKQMEEAKRILNSVNIQDELFHSFPGNMSGGEQQRVAIARCIASNASVIGADEPTGNLDIKNSKEITGMLKKITYEQNKITVIVTHDIYIAKMADECFELSGGQLKRISLDEF